MRIDEEKLYAILDSLLSEYGGTIEYWIKLPHTIILSLSEAIVSRKKEELKLKAKVYAMSVSAGFNGKMEIVDNLFSDEKDEEKQEEKDNLEFKAETKALWQQFGKDPEEFERKWEAGEQIII